MSNSAPRLAMILLALVLTASGVALGSTGPDPTLPGPIVPFGCHA